MIKYLLALMVFFPLYGISRAEDPPELRAVYAPVYSINTQAACDQIIANVLASNLNAVFVEVRGRADAYYYPNRNDSTYPNNEPRGQLYAISPANLDILQYFIDRLHAATPRREVHAWCTTFNSWNRTAAPASPDHVFNDHPEWITRKKDGTAYTSTDDAPLDPGLPEVREHIYNVFMDIVRNYDIDGIHFDYIRLLGSDSGYHPSAKQQFLARTGWDFDTQNSGGQLDAIYNAWRRDQISQLVQRIYNQTQLEKSWVEVSAFLVKFEDSIVYLGQGYNWWTAHGAIDVLHAGCYASTISGTTDAWDFYVSKLAQNGDQNTRPVVCALGDYLLTDADENSGAVTALRANSRPPDGFNFFEYSSLYLTGTSTPDQNAKNLFDPGRPMSAWAPVPAMPHKTMEETLPPNIPEGLSIMLANAAAAPRITFSRPAPASDGDLPVHYRLYRGASFPVSLYYQNMIMEWWDTVSARSSFVYDDEAAPEGLLYYCVAAYDDWNNQACATAGPVNASAGVIIIDDGDSGFTASGAGSWTSISSVNSYGGDYLFAQSGVPAASARWTPANALNGKYSVYAWYRAGSNRASNAPYTIFYSGQSATVRVNQQTNGGQWNLLGTYSFDAQAPGYVELSNDAAPIPSVIIADAIRFVRAALPQAIEPKPAVSAPASADSEVIVDSHPTTLDYDDVNASNSWQDTSAYAGYYHSNARYYASTNAFPIRNYAVWIADLPRAGRWAIDGWTRHSTSFAAQAQYRFVDRGGSVHNVTASQRSTHNDTSAGDWLINVDGVEDAGAYSFDEGRVYVTLYGSASGAAALIADALRFRLLAPLAPETNEWILY